MEELISVIVPAYNIEDYLPRCLACIEMQTYNNLEIILVDDGSTDSTGRICDEYAVKDKRARVIHHPQNIGLWAARNTGQDAAHGEYIWMPDGDDYFHKDIVKVMMEAINQTCSSGEKYDLVIVKHAQTFRFDEDVSSEIKPAFVEKTLEEVLDVFMCPEDHFTGRNVWNKLCRKELIRDIRTGNYKYAQDCDLSLKVYLKSPRIIYVDTLLYYFLRRPSCIGFTPGYSLHSKQCLVRVLYDNYISRDNIPACYRRFILEMMYMFMVIILDMEQGTNNIDVDRKEYRVIIRSTWWTYLSQCTERTPLKRLRRILRIRFNKIHSALL